MNYETIFIVPPRFNGGYTTEEIKQIKGILYPAQVGQTIECEGKMYLVAHLRDEIHLRNTYRYIELAKVQH